MRHDQLKLSVLFNRQIFEVHRIVPDVICPKNAKRADPWVYLSTWVFLEKFREVYRQSGVLPLQVAPSLKTGSHRVATSQALVQTMLAKDVAGVEIVKLEERSTWTLSILAVIAVITDVDPHVLQKVLILCVGFDQHIVTFHVIKHENSVLEV